MEGSWDPEVHFLAERIVQDENLGRTPLERIFYVCQQVLKYHPDPITGEMIIWPRVMARKLYEFLYENKQVDRLDPMTGKNVQGWKHPQPMGDCVPEEQEILVCNRATGKYETRCIGSLEKDYLDYDALSYDFDAKQWVFNRIVRWYNKGVKDVFLVRLKDGREFECTENHRVFRYLRGRSLKKGEAKIIDQTLAEMGASLGGPAPQTIAAFKIPNLDKVKLGVDKSWLYGIYLAEGSGYSSNNRVAIAQSKMDVRLKIEDVLKRLGVPVKFYDRGRESGGQYYTFLGEIARELNALGKNSFDKKIPDELLSVNAEEAMAILDGLAAGDAWFPNDHDWRGKYLRCVYATSSDGIKEAVRFYGMLTGRMMSSWYQKNHMGVGKHPIWRITERIVSNGNNKSHIHYHEIHPGISNAYVASIEPIGKKKVCDITVADTHNFVTRDGVILHQCDDKSCMLMALLFNRRYPCRAVGAWQSEAMPMHKQINHVYPEVKLGVNQQGLIDETGAEVEGERWVPMEPSSSTLKFGQQRPTVVPLKYYYARIDGQAIQ